MASAKGGKCKSSYYRAKLVTNVGTCVFCQRSVDDEIIYGKLYAIGDIQCHYFCALLSCCLIQKGSDEEGLFGFRYSDILAEVKRSKKHKCSYCNRDGANIGCCITQCRKQFHLPCGRERNSVSLFYGNYKSFCASHAPKQKVADAIAPIVKLRVTEERRRSQKNGRNQRSCTAECDGDGDEPVCVICYEPVPGLPAPQTFWPPCCARDAWLHRTCLQRMALSAGMHYLKCPLCNDKETFYRAVLDQGYYVPDRDAAWELEQNAFADIYERPVACAADHCRCALGRAHDSDAGPWDLKLCILCGSMAIHAACADVTEDIQIYICKICQPAAPSDLGELIASIENVQLQEQAAEAARLGPVMPSRMSLRRTKRRPLINDRPSSSRNVSYENGQVQLQEQASEAARLGPIVPSEMSLQSTKRRALIINRPSSSRNLSQNQHENRQDAIKTTESSRLDLDLKKPRRRVESTANSDNVPLSPMKMLERGLGERLGLLESTKVLETLRERLRKPRPLVVKKRIVSKIVDELLSNIKDPKSKEPLKEWNSPKKMCDITVEDCKENLNAKFKDITQAINRFGNNKHDTTNSPTKTFILQFGSSNFDGSNVKIDEEFKCNFKHRHLDTKLKGGKLRTAMGFALDAFETNKKRLKRKLSAEKGVHEKRRKIVEIEDSINDKTLGTTDGDKNITERDEGIDETRRNIAERNKGIGKKRCRVIDVEKGSIKKETFNVVSDNLKAENSTGCRDSKTNDKNLITLKKGDSNGLKIKRNVRRKITKGPVKKITDVSRSVNDFVAPSNAIKPELDFKTEGDNKIIRKRQKVFKSSLKKGSVRKTANLNMKYINSDFTNNVQVKQETGIDFKDLKATNKVDFEKTRKRRRRGTKSMRHVNLTVTNVDKELKLQYKKKNDKLSIKNRGIKVKIKWRKQQLNLRITEERKSKRSRKINTPKVLKQYVLKYSPDATPTDVIAKPDRNMTPVVRKRVKKEKGTDNLIQTNISSFFKTTPRSLS